MRTLAALLLAGGLTLIPAASHAQAPNLEDCASNRDWASRAGAVAGTGFRVWAYCDGKEVQDLTRAVALISSFWSDMVRFMGDPLQDEGGLTLGGDRKIDFYLTVPITMPPGNTRGMNFCALSPHVRSIGNQCEYMVVGTGYASASPISEHSVGSSGYVLVDRSRIADPMFRATLLHEFFHILQYRYNHQLGTPTKGAVAGSRNWFVEASATWAETYFDRPRSNLVHDYYFPRWQQSGKPLTTPEPQTLTYAAYVYPFFMQQEVGADAIAQVWKAMATKKGDTGMLEAIDAVVPFKDKFRVFALRNLNKAYGSAVTPLYSALDPNLKSSLGAPLFVIDGDVLPAQRKDAPPIEPAIDIAPLTARYYRYKLAPEVKQVTFDFTDLQPVASLSNDAVMLMRGNKWRKKEMEGKVKFCRNRADEDVQEIILVMSNHDVKQAGNVKGKLRITPRVDACKGWSGILTYSDVDKFNDTSSDACRSNNNQYSKSTIGSIQFAEEAATYTITSDLTDNREETDKCPGSRTDKIMSSAHASGGGAIDAVVEFSTDLSYNIRFQFPELKGKGKSTYTYSREPSRNFTADDDYVVDFSADGASCYPDEKQPAKLKVLTSGDDWEQVCEVDNWQNPSVLIGNFVSKSGSRTTKVTWRLRRD